MTSLRLPLALAGLALSAFIVSIAFVWARHALIHWFINIGPHDHLFVLNLSIRSALVVSLSVVIRYVVCIRTLYGWALAGVAVAAVAYPLILAGILLADNTPHLMAARGAIEVPYEILAATYGMNLIGGAIYGALGWLFLRRLMPD